MMDDISETDRIERDLARTRARMDSRLEELQDHLTPKQMLNDAFGYFRGGEGADFTKDLVTRARANPLPVALTGIGIAWLMASTQKSGPTPHLRPQSNDFETRLRLAEGGVQRFDHDDDASYAGRLDDARGKVVGVARNASDTASSFAQRVKDAVAAASQSLRETSHDFTASANDALQRLGNRADKHGAALQEGTHDMTNSSRNAFSSIASNPFALGGFAAIVGLVAGSLLPVSDEEQHAQETLQAGKDSAQTHLAGAASSPTDQQRS